MTNPPAPIERVKAGVPTGGEFAAHNRNESDTSLDAAIDRERLFDEMNELLSTRSVDIPTELSQAEIFRNGQYGTQALFTEPLPGGYTEINAYNDGALSFGRDGIIHRTDGPAFIRANGEKIYAIQGEEIDPFDGGEAGYELISADEDGSVQHWEAEDGRAIDILENGDVTFWKDGKLHRDGGPALIHASGREDWWQNGKYVTSPIPDYRKYDETAPVGPVQYRTATGSKYNPDQTINDISKATKRDVMYAAKLGVLPENTTVSVRVERYSMGQTLHVNVNGFTEDQLYKVNPDTGDREYTVTSRRIKSQLERIAKAYQRSETDNQTDYNASNFHLNVSLRTS